MKKSDKNLILMAIGILLALGTWFFVYKNLTAETETMQKANAELRKEVEYLQELADNKQKYIDDTAAMQAKIEEIKAQFPAQYLPEDDITYMIEAEKEHDASVKSISIGTTMAVEVVAPTTEEATAEETTTEETADASTEVSTEETAKTDILLYKTPVTANFLSSYNSIKEVIKKINDDGNRKSVDTFSVTFDSQTGELLSSVSMSMYSLTGTEAEYKSPTIDGVTYGTSDIFNSAKKKAQVQATKNATEE